MDREKLVLTWLFAFLACVVYALVLFIPPVTGVADNTDFARLMYGLDYQGDKAHYMITLRFRHYVPAFDMVKFPYDEILSQTPFSPIVLIWAARMITRLFGMSDFRLWVLAGLNGVIYISSLSVIYYKLADALGSKTLPAPVRRIFRISLGALFLLVFLDGRWLMWFNSLYSEPYAIIGMAMLIAAFVCAYENPRPVSLFFFWAGGFLLLGAKIPYITLYPVCAGLSLCIFLRLKKSAGATGNNGIGTPDILKRVKMFLLPVMLIIQLLYCLAVYSDMGDKWALNRQTIYHSVMTGLLDDSPDPAAVLDKFGLDHRLLEDIGKSAYAEEYAYYSPWDAEMQELFYDKVTNMDLVKYYLTHPAALARGLRFLGRESLYTTTYMGINEESYPHVTDHSRFTVWSGIRHALPKSFAFLLIIFTLCLAASIAAEAKKLIPPQWRAVLWSLLFIGITQFPLPYIFNGKCDTKKQLLLFNYVFDTVIIAFICMSAAAVLFSLRKYYKRKW
jgi:hypothetical protein